MNGFDFSFDDDGTVFRDVILLALLGFVTIVILLLPHLNPKATDAEAQPPGNVMVEARWADEINADVDLWVQGPGDAAVGYSNKSGAVFDLLRDDLGHSRDITGLNYETAYSRGAPAGEYVVNLHLYNNKAMVLPIEVAVAVSLRGTNGKDIMDIGARTILLSHQGEEVTVLRFRLDERARPVPGSTHTLPKKIRSSGI